MYASISADIVSSTSHSERSMIALNERIREGLAIVEQNYDGLWGRIVRGDTIECILDHPEDAFEVAIILKAWIKSFNPIGYGDYSRFRKYGIRLAIGIGGMNIINRKLDLMDGEAIYRSGRTLDKLVGRSKYSMIISMEDKDIEEPLNIILSLINNLLNNATSRRCLTLCERLLSSSTIETADKMNITISGVNQSLNEMGWTSIKQAISYYRKTIRHYVI